MKFNYAKLRGRMVELYGSVSGFSDEIGVAVQTVCSKLNNNKNITKKDIVQWCSALQISIDEIGTYFFTPKV